MRRIVLALTMVGIAMLMTVDDSTARLSVKADTPTATFAMLSNVEFSGDLCSVDTPPAGRSAAWAFVETFDGDPTAPSQDLLPRTFDYVVTHRTHPAEHLKTFDTYPADHDMNCTGPDPGASPLPQHMVVTSHLTNGSHPDPSFFICKDHLMSSMGEVEGYSVTSFWPKQEFDFANGGVLEFDVNLNGNHPRSWWEVVILPRAQLRVGAAHQWFPIDETYPEERIVFDFSNDMRSIQVGAGAIEPEGIVAANNEWTPWAERHLDDPANNDRRIRRTNRIILNRDRITWSIAMADGSFDEYSIDVPGGLPFTRGLVLFKTHAYTPHKEGNLNGYTFHWDNIRFSGPLVGLYNDYEANDLAYLQGNGSRPIGETATVTITLPTIETKPFLFGQVHNAIRGQVLLRINNGPQMVVHPPHYVDNDCYSSGWESFYLPLEQDWVHEGENTFTWEIGPRPTCVEDWVWDGFSVKNLEVQLDVPFDHSLYLPLIEQ